MVDRQTVVKEIIKSCTGYFPQSLFSLRRKDHNRFVIDGDLLTPAIDNYNNDRYPVKVLKWFADFWVYVEINFMKVEIEKKPRAGINKQDYLSGLSESLFKIGKDYFETTITLSVFQGGAALDNKTQLFRAEWDNRLDNGTHPQPHWHIYPDLRLIKSFEEFVEITDEGGFADMLHEEKSKCIDLSRIHFAMNGQWSTNEGHFHKISDENTIKYWFHGLLGHIKSQLQYWKSP